MKLNIRAGQLFRDKSPSTLSGDHRTNTARKKTSMRETFRLRFLHFIQRFILVTQHTKTTV